MMFFGSRCRAIIFFYVPLLGATHERGVRYSSSNHHQMNVKEYIEKLYSSISGYSIPGVERKIIEDHGGEPTYGEITFDGASGLIRELGIKKGDVFYDLGSGVGKLVVQVYLEVPVKKSVGIELSKTRHTSAIAILENLRHDKKIVRCRTLEFMCCDILSQRYADATHIYTASLCFSDDFMEKLTAHLAKHGKKGLVVASLRPLADNYGFSLIKIKSHSMTWSDSTSVYFYQLESKK